MDSDEQSVNKEPTPMDELPDKPSQAEGEDPDEEVRPVQEASGKPSQAEGE